MDIHYELEGTAFVWNDKKAAGNPKLHEGQIMSISERIKTRLSKDRVMTTITLRIGQDVVDSMKNIAPRKGLAGYQTLLKSYISDGLRQDEAKFSNDTSAKLYEVLRKHGVSQTLLDEVDRELKAA